MDLYRFKLANPATVCSILSMASSTSAVAIDGDLRAQLLEVLRRTAAFAYRVALYLDSSRFPEEIFNNPRFLPIALSSSAARHLDTTKDEEKKQHKDNGSEDFEDDATVVAGSDSATEGSTDIETALEPHMRKVECMGLKRPPLPKAPTPFRSKREQERLTRGKFRKKAIQHRGPKGFRQPWRKNSH